MDDGSCVDIGVCARTDKQGILVVYYHTSEEYVRNDNLSYQNIVQGYSLEVDGTIVVARGDKIVAGNDESLVGSSIETVPTLAGHPCAGPSGCQDHPHPRDDGQRLCGGPPESSCGGHDRTSDQAAGPGQRLPDAGEVLPESGMNLPPDFTTLPKHDKVKILCPSSKKDTSGGGESCRESTQHDTASQPRTERMLLQWNRAKRPLI